MSHGILQVQITIIIRCSQIFTSNVGKGPKRLIQNIISLTWYVCKINYLLGALKVLV